LHDLAIWKHIQELIQGKTVQLLCGMRIPSKMQKTFKCSYWRYLSVVLNSISSLDV
jgi:hypothetical protein